MRTRIREYITGYLKIRIVGYSPERFFNMCSHHNIHLWNLTFCGHAYEMNLSVKDFRRLKPIIRKTKTKVKVIERAGFPFFLEKYKKRKIFVTGLIFCMLFLFFMTRFIWSIQIDGNYKYSDEEIVKALKMQSVCIGKMRKNIHCEEITTYLRRNYPDIIWVSASVEGIYLKIEVKENMDHPYQEDAETEAPSDLIAEKDGMITDIITRHGTPLVHIGDSVKKGDCLVSGNIPIYNDSKEIVGYQYTVADADVMAQTEFTYEDSLSSEHSILVKTGKKKWGVWADIFDRRFYFGKPSSGYSYYKTLESEKNLVIGNQWKLPFSFGILEHQECDYKKESYSEAEASSILNENFQKFCKKLEEKGVQILQNGVKIYTGVERTTAKGVLILNEKIGNSVVVQKESASLKENKTEEE